MPARIKLQAGQAFACHYLILEGEYLKLAKVELDARGIITQLLPFTQEEHSTLFFSGAIFFVPIEEVSLLEVPREGSFSSFKSKLLGKKLSEIYHLPSFIL